MEIEAKFNVPDREVWQRLQALDRLAGFDLVAGRVKRVRDIYLDTPDRHIFYAGYACRLRQQDDEYLITLKALGGAQDAIHRRQELEATVPPVLSPAQWPPSPARERLVELIGSSPLLPLFELEQERWVRNLMRGDRRIAEWSLDDVRVLAGGQEQAYLQLEVELGPQGDDTDLARIAACLRDEWKLLPEPCSKFERAFSLIAK